MQEYIKMPDLKTGYLYRIRARNGAFGIWEEKRKGFIISRVKFRANFPFTEYHHDTGAPFGTVLPLEEIEQSPFSVEELNENNYDLIYYINRFEKARREKELRELNPVVSEEKIQRLLSGYLMAPKEESDG